MIDTAIDIPDSALSTLRVKAEQEVNETSRLSFLKALDSLQRFLGDADIAIGDFSGELIGEWVAWLFSNGYSHKTVTYYVNRLSALHGKVVRDAGLQPSEAFRTIKDRLREASPASLEVNAIPGCFARLRQLVITDCSRNPARQLAKDILLFSIYNGGLSFERIAAYGKTDYNGDSEAILAIVSRYARPKNKYLFPLNQSARTPAQLRREVSSLFSDALRTIGISLTSAGSNLPADLWANAAMTCGFSASDIAGCLPAGGDNPLFSFVERPDLSVSRQEEIRNRVAQVLAKDPEEWYAMQFRPFIDYDRVQRRFDENGITFSQTFYPMREIVRRVGKAVRHIQKPVMPGLFFFKSKAADLPRLFFQIGDLAWGYRHSRSARTPYAVISRRQIEAYQKAVGQFVDCIADHPEGILHLEQGDKVEITGGIYEGRTAVFEKEVRQPDKSNGSAPRLIYRLRLTDSEQYTWTVDLDPRQLTLLQK